MKFRMLQRISQPKEVRYKLSIMIYNGADALLIGESLHESGFKVNANCYLSASLARLFVVIGMP